MYLVTGAYILIDNNPVITFILVLFLLVYHIVTLNTLIERVSADKEVSVIKLQHKLDESKKESEEKELNFLSLTQAIGSGVILINDDGIIDFSKCQSFAWALMEIDHAGVRLSSLAQYWACCNDNHRD